ncbi:MAG TPA: hypothetical protein VNE71_12390 [Myxococcota bacterium]|nr:hypothetical protein [Myxococcota bacterium]
MRVARFPAGLAHWVYDVALASGRALVVRIGGALARPMFAAAARLSGELRPLGVPLPELLAAGDADGRPYLILERLPGTDLRFVYRALARAEKDALAERVADAQARVARRPEGRGFGYAAHPDGPFSHGSWTDVIRASLARSRGRVADVRAPEIAAMPRLERAVERLALGLDAVRPTPFLDDTTTKNVIVDRGALSGIVDVDWLGYGDPLLPIALTRAALLSEELDTDYVDAWCRHARPDAAASPLLRLYTAVFCADFLSEAGQAFNRDRPHAIADDHARRLAAILDDQLAGL